MFSCDAAWPCEAHTRHTVTRGPTDMRFRNHRTRQLPGNVLRWERQHRRSSASGGSRAVSPEQVAFDRPSFCLVMSLVHGASCEEMAFGDLDGMTSSSASGRGSSSFSKRPRLSVLPCAHCQAPESRHIVEARLSRWTSVMRYITTRSYRHRFLHIDVPPRQGSIHWTKAPGNQIMSRVDAQLEKHLHESRVGGTIAHRADSDQAPRPLLHLTGLSTQYMVRCKDSMAMTRNT